MKRGRCFTAGGLALMAWALVNAGIDIHRYGASWGSYFWFCNLALFGTGVGLLLRSRGLLTGFLAIASFTQLFWLIDNIFRRFHGRGYFGLLDFRYEPGYPQDEFILAVYHYFTIPIALLALLFLPRKKNNTLKLVMLFNPLIFAVSYFAFSSGQNINCIHEACFPGLKQWQGPIYALCFWAVVFIVHLVLAYEMNRWLLSFRLTRKTQRRALTAFYAVCVFGLVLAVSDVREKLSIPSFSCLEPQTIDEVTSGCQYTRVYHGNRLLLGYYVENKKADDQLCSVTLEQGDTSLVLNHAMTASPNERAVFSTPIAKPARDTTARVVTLCKPFLSQAEN